MNRTRPGSLIGLGVAGLVIGFLAELAASSMGVPVFIPPLTFPITLLAVAIIAGAVVISKRREVVISDDGDNTGSSSFTPHHTPDPHNA